MPWIVFYALAELQSSLPQKGKYHWWRTYKERRDEREGKSLLAAVCDSSSYGALHVAKGHLSSRTCFSGHPFRLSFHSLRRLSWDRYTHCFMSTCDVLAFVLVTFSKQREGKRTTTNPCQFGCLWDKGAIRHWLNWPGPPAGLKCFWLSEQCFKVMKSDAVKGMVAACNECFPVGWTVTLWMAGDSRPGGGRIRDSPAISHPGPIWSDKVQHLPFCLSPKLFVRLRPFRAAPIYVSSCQHSHLISAGLDFFFLPVFLRHLFLHCLWNETVTSLRSSFADFTLRACIHMTTPSANYMSCADETLSQALHVWRDSLALRFK